MNRETITRTKTKEVIRKSPTNFLKIITIKEGDITISSHISTFTRHK